MFIMFHLTVVVSYMSKIALTSHEWAGALTKYLESNSWKKRFILLANTYQKDVSNEDPFATTGEILFLFTGASRLGALLKALTIPKLTVDRINFMISFVEAVHDDVKQVDGWFRLFSSVSWFLLCNVDTFFFNLILIIEQKNMHAN